MKIILFDGVCNFCNSTVNFIIKRDKDKIFHFAPLQSEKSRELMVGKGKNNKDLDSIVFIDEDELFEGIDAVAGILKYLTGYKFLYKIIRFLPYKLNNSIYRTIAKNRYRWFGKRDICRVPEPEERDVFL